MSDLMQFVTDTATELAVPGVAVGILHEGKEHYAFHGVTSIEHPLPVDASTIFQFGSTGKTFTATAMMRLVDQGLVDLDAPVRRYVPELKLLDESVAERVTVFHLLNHTAGWAGDFFPETGDGDDALTKYVELMATIEQESPLGSTVSYNNAAFCLAGRVIERVTGKTYEQAIHDLLYEPLQLDNSFFFPNEIMTRRFAIGHDQQSDGSITVARPWMMSRGNAPAGSRSCANAADQIGWAKFHVGDGRAPDGKQLLPPELLARMQEPTADMRGHALGDHVGLAWLLRDADGTRVVGHGGGTNGQASGFTMVPERDFAVISLTNCRFNGHQLHSLLVQWAFEAFLGIDDRDPEPIELSDAALAAYAGRYDTAHLIHHVHVAAGRLVLTLEMTPQMAATVQEAPQSEDQDQSLPVVELGIVAGDGDQFIATSGPTKGMKGHFVRNEAGAVAGMNIGGRLATRAEGTS